MPAFLKFFTEFGPLVAFFLSHKIFVLSAATATIIIFSLISLAITYYFTKKLSPLLIATVLILAIFGSLTLFTGNMIFIKIKPTILNILFAAILLGGAFITKKGLLKYILGEKIPLTDEAWVIFSKRWGYFFLFLATINEIIWRNFSEEFWVTFKAFGMISITLIFMLTQISFLAKNNPDNINKQ